MNSQSASQCAHAQTPSPQEFNLPYDEMVLTAAIKEHKSPTPIPSTQSAFRKRKTPPATEQPDAAEPNAADTAEPAPSIATGSAASALRCLPAGQTAKRHKPEFWERVAEWKELTAQLEQLEQKRQNVLRSITSETKVCKWHLQKGFIVPINAGYECMRCYQGYDITDGDITSVQ